MKILDIFVLYFVLFFPKATAFPHVHSPYVKRLLVQRYSKSNKLSGLDTPSANFRSRKSASKVKSPKSKVPIERLDEFSLTVVVFSHGFATSYACCRSIFHLSDQVTAFLSAGFLYLLYWLIVKTDYSNLVFNIFGKLPIAIGAHIGRLVGNLLSAGKVELVKAINRKIDEMKIRTPKKTKSSSSEKDVMRRFDKKLNAKKK